MKTRIYAAAAVKGLKLSYLNLNHLKFIDKQLSKLFFHPPEVVSRYRDPQLQAGVNITQICLILDQIFANFRV